MPLKGPLKYKGDNRAARLGGNSEGYKIMSRMIKTLLRRDKESYVRGLADDVEGCLKANDYRRAFRALKKLRYTLTS